MFVVMQPVRHNFCLCIFSLISCSGCNLAFLPRLLSRIKIDDNITEKSTPPEYNNERVFDGDDGDNVDEDESAEK